MITKNDLLKRYCPKLGHELAFSYCRQPGEDRACGKIFDCWWEVFDIKKFMEENYSEEDIKQILSPSKPKAMSLLDIIKEAKERAKKKF